jgi:hypothetical protein
MKETLTTLQVKCTDAESRALLVDLKTSCQNGWFFETFRITAQGLMIYKFFLLDLAQQQQVDDEQYVRYYGWVEVTESDGVMTVKPAGDLENMVAPELRTLLLTRFHDDVLDPVCKRHRIWPTLVT